MGQEASNFDPERAFACQRVVCTSCDTLTLPPSNDDRYMREVNHSTYLGAYLVISAYQVEGFQASAALCLLSLGLANTPCTTPMTGP